MKIKENIPLCWYSFVVTVCYCYHTITKIKMMLFDAINALFDSSDVFATRTADDTAEMHFEELRLKFCYPSNHKAI